MAQKDYQFAVSPPPGLSTTSALSDSSSTSSLSSRQGYISDTSVASPDPSTVVEQSIPRRPNYHKRNSNVVKRSYSKVMKSTSLMFKPKSRRESFSGKTSLDSPSDKEHTISLSELDARLHILEQAEKSTATDSENLAYPTPVAQNKPSLTPHFTTPRWKGTPCLIQVSEQDDQAVPLKVQTPRPDKKTRANQLLLYFVAGLLAIPNVALSWAPMTVTIIVGSAIAVLYGYRLAVALPVLMLLNPASPIWRENDSRMRGRDVIVFGPQQSGHGVYRSRPSSPHEKRLAAISRRYSTS